MNEPEKTKEKKAWHKPELLVLARSNPEEQVLTACKLQNFASGRFDSFEQCYYTMAPCLTCDSLGAS